MTDTSFCMSGSHPFGYGTENKMKELTFTKYPSITPVSMKRSIEYIIQNGLDQQPWIATVKLHGANFQITTNGSDIKTGKRSGFIVPADGGFNGYQNVLAKYQQNIFEFYRHMSLLFDFDQLTLCGELFGGQYDHPDVDRDVHATRVQKGVQYCPHNDMSIFDIKVDNMFINKMYVNVAVNDFDFIGSTPVFQGSFRDCMKLNAHIQDPTYKKFGLPKLEGDNLCEGLVYEPEEPAWFPNGKRVKLKHVNPEFAEKTGRNKVRKPAVIHEWSDEGMEELQEMYTYINENRLRHILSHHGQFTQKTFGKLLGLFAKDVFTDYLEERNDQFEALSKKEQGIFKKDMQKKCGDCIRPNFVAIIENEF